MEGAGVVGGEGGGEERRGGGEEERGGGERGRRGGRGEVSCEVANCSKLHFMLHI